MKGFRFESGGGLRKVGVKCRLTRWAEQSAAFFGKREAGRRIGWELRRGLRSGRFRSGGGHRSRLAREADGPEDDLGG
jgi:hypothetical protein